MSSNHWTWERECFNKILTKLKLLKSKWTCWEMCMNLSKRSLQLTINITLIIIILLKECHYKHFNFTIKRNPVDFNSILFMNTRLNSLPHWGTLNRRFLFKQLIGKISLQIIYEVLFSVQIQTNLTLRAWSVKIHQNKLLP